MKDKLTRKIIELIFGCEFEEAILIEPERCNDENDVMYHRPDITIWRVMEALITFNVDEEVDISKIEECFSMILRRDRKLTKENWQEATLDDQTPETIEKLYELIK